MNPFDPKTALLAKHAQHPVIIHFPIALFVVSVLFDVLAWWKTNPAMARAAYYNLLASAATAPLAIGTGLAAWQWQLEGARLSGNLRLHLSFALATSIMIWLLSGWRWFGSRLTDARQGARYFLLAAITLVLVTITGHLGAILSGVDG